MTLLAYQVFKTVVEQGSFNKAADLLNLTPSAISHGINAMEKELGFPLFVRNKKGISLTSYGENLLPFINGVLNSEESLQQAIAQVNGLQQGTVKLGCFSSVCTAWIPKLVASFKKDYPNITIQIFQGTYADVAAWIKNGVVDLGFLSDSSANGLELTSLYSDPLLCITPKHYIKGNHPDYIEPEELAEFDFVSQRESTDADVQIYLQKNKVNIKSSCHVVDDISQIAMVSSGMGVCLMPELVMRDMPYDVDTYKLKPAEDRVIGICVLNEQLMPPAAKMLHRHIVKMFKKK
ncbi:MAG: LysR family transcriptional regulator [Lachnospiraceae bacterium]|nr:LysR family transcriptional regulator [Lachnospiraceae bacterium]